MIPKWLTFRLNADQEDRFRQANLGVDAAQARICILLMIVPLMAFAANDYIFFGLSWRFYAITTVRLALLVHTLLLLGRLRRINSYRIYDKAEFAWGLFFALFTLAVAATRPQAFIAHTITVVLAVFVTVLAIPNRFSNQLILSIIYTAGETLIIASGFRNPPQAITALFSMYIANAIAVACGRQLHSWRRREFLAREEERQAEVEAERQLLERKKAEEALKEHREWFRVTLSSIGDAVLTTDTQGRITFLNPLAQSLTGWQFEEASGRPVQDVFRIINEKTRQPAENIVERIFREGRVVNLANHTALITRDGREIPIEDSAAPIRDGAGDLIGVVLVFHDVAEQRKAQESLLRAKQEWERTFDHVPDLVAIIDTQYRVVRVNRAMADRLGATPARSIGLYCYESVHGAHEPPDYCPHAMALRDGREHVAEVHEEKLGGDFLVSATPLFDEQGVVIGTVHVARDITEWKQSREALRESEEKYRHLFENMTEEVHFWRIVRDEAGRIKTWRLLDANPPTLKTWGWNSLDEIKGKTTDEIFGVGAADHYMPVVQKIFTEGVPYSFEDYFPNLDKHFRFTSVPLGDCFITTGADITSMKKAERDLRNARDEAEKHAKELEALMDAVPALIWMSRDTECLSMTGNRAVYEFLGLPAGANVSKTAPEDERPVHFRALKDGMEIPVDELPMQQAAKGYGVQDCELEYVFDDGTSKITLGNATPLRDAAGHAYGAIAAFVDITDRKQAEEALRESRAKLQAALASIPDALFISDAEGRLVHFNDGFVTYHRFGSRDECSKSVAECPEFLEAYMSDGQPAPPEMWPIPRALRGEKVANTEYTLRRRETGETWIGSYSFGPIRDEEGVIVGSVVSARDITGIKKAQNALRESEERLRLFVEHAPASLAMFDRQMRYLSVSRRWLRDYNLGERNIIGLSHYEVFPEIPDYWKEIHRRGLAGEVIREDDDRFERADGSVQRVRWEVRPWRDAEGEVAGIVIFTEDATERKRIEEELRENQARLDLALRSSEMGVWHLDIAENKRVFDDQVCRLLGIDSPKFSGAAEEFFEALHPDDRDKVRAALAKTIEHGRPYETEYRAVWPDGSIHHITARGGLLCDDKGQAVRVNGLIWDVTERRQMEEELRKSRDKLELIVSERTAELVTANEELQKQADLLNLSHDAILVVDSGGVVSFWSKGAEDLYGFTREQAVGNVAYEFLHTIFPQPLEHVIKQAIATGQWAGELTQTTSSGRVLAIESRWALRRGNDGKPTGFLEVNRDITAKKMAEEKFKKADRAYRTLGECNQAMVRETDEMELLREICQIVVDIGGYRMAWVGFAENDQAKTVRPVAIAGYEQGYLDQAKITWADTERGRGPCGTSIRTGKTAVSLNAGLNPAFAPWRFEAARRGYASSISLPLVVESNVIGALGIFASEPDAFDEAESGLLSNLAENLSYGITSIRSAEKRRRAEEELRVYASRLEVINKELQDFAFVAAHDLQEPLRKIQTFCDMAMKRCAPVLDSAGKEYLDRVLNSASRMRDLLRDLLQFSRLAVNIEPFEKVDLKSLVREAADVFETLIKELNCRIDIKDLPAIEADSSQILQLFQNLIGNALKFRSDETPHVKVYGKSDVKGMCEIFIEDNGIGFDQQFAEQIFKPFQRLHGRHEYDGTGMGLAICRKIVERHGGAIRVESVSGKGSKFIVRLPLKQPRLENVSA
jgi:PAS domain S-box-containing protein